MNLTSGILVSLRIVTFGLVILTILGMLGVQTGVGISELLIGLFIVFIFNLWIRALHHPTR